MPSSNSERHSASDAATQRLTPREARFVANYVSNGFNATQAWLSATGDLGLKPPSPEAAHVSANRALRRATVRQAVDRQQQAVAVRAEWQLTDLLTRQQRVYERAMALDKLSDANTALRQYAELTGRLHPQPGGNHITLINQLFASWQPAVSPTTLGNRPATPALEGSPLRQAQGNALRESSQSAGARGEEQAREHG